jgi:hypothetical protein
MTGTAVVLWHELDVAASALGEHLAFSQRHPQMTSWHAIIPCVNMLLSYVYVNASALSTSCIIQMHALSASGYKVRIHTKTKIACTDPVPCQTRKEKTENWVLQVPLATYAD